jgi:hypothetical protein
MGVIRRKNKAEYSIVNRKEVAHLVMIPQNARTSKSLGRLRGCGLGSGVQISKLAARVD